MVHEPHEPHEHLLHPDEVFRTQGAVFEVNRVIVELKALGALAPEDRAQLIDYLKSTRLRVGLLVNFGCAPKARIERLVL